MVSTPLLVVIVGLALFFVPEPITSAIGALVVLAGLAWYVLGE